jgi:hypothetical protein
MQGSEFDVPQSSCDKKSNYDDHPSRFSSCKITNQKGAVKVPMN